MMTRHETDPNIVLVRELGVDARCALGLSAELTAEFHYGESEGLGEKPTGIETSLPTMDSMVVLSVRG